VALSLRRANHPKKVASSTSLRTSAFYPHLGAFASLTKSQITVELTKEVLHNTLKGPQREVTVESKKSLAQFFLAKKFEKEYEFSCRIARAAILPPL
jgi:hypothetical protein